MTDREQLSVRIDKKLNREITSFCKRNGIFKTYFCVLAFEDYLSKRKRERKDADGNRSR